MASSRTNVVDIPSPKMQPEEPEAENPLAAKKQKKSHDSGSDFEKPTAKVAVPAKKVPPKTGRLTTATTTKKANMYSEPIDEQVKEFVKLLKSGNSAAPAPAVVPPPQNSGSFDGYDSDWQGLGRSSLLWSDKKTRFKKGVNPVDLVFTNDQRPFLKKLSESIEIDTSDSDGSSSSDAHGDNILDAASEDKAENPVKEDKHPKEKAEKK